MSLSLMMLTAAGLFVHSAVRASNIQPGFSLENEALAEVDASLIAYDEARSRQLYRSWRSVCSGSRHVKGGVKVSTAAE